MILSKEICVRALPSAGRYVQILLGLVDAIPWIGAAPLCLICI